MGQNLALLPTPQDTDKILQYLDTNFKRIADAFALVLSGAVSHDDLTDVSADDHHAQSHSHGSHTGIGANDHHNEVHTHSDFLVPRGAIFPFADDAVPTGWLLCDGQAISRTTYADLFNLIGTTYGAGDGSTTFNVPNLKGRVPVGRDAGDTDWDTLGETRGSKTHTLTTAEMPPHTHTIPLQTTGLNGTNRNIPNSSPSLTINTGSTGGGDAHNNIQPSIVLNYIIKF